MVTITIVVVVVVVVAVVVVYKLNVSKGKMSGVKDFWNQMFLVKQVIGVKGSCFWCKSICGVKALLAQKPSGSRVFGAARGFLKGNL